VEADIKALLKPEVLNTVNGLELVARIVVEGFMSGANKSQAIGFGQEFSQYRSYEPGDDLRQFDWKVYARSEKSFIKQAEIETNITVKFMLDASNSMAYTENGITKLQYAKVIIASLAYLARKQSDTFGLSIVNDKQVSVIHPRFEQQQLLRFLLALVNARPGSKWKRSGVDHLFDHHGKEMIIFVSDLYDDRGDLPDFVARLKTRRNEVIVIHLLGKREIDLDFHGSFTFRDLEDGATMKVDTRVEKDRYIENVKSWIKHSRQRFLEKDIHYHMFTMNDNISEVLRDFLTVRKNLRW
jgi:uncharacterized protein (DUF58 family)